ncbi:MAG: hypothetical protein V4623_08775 [Pseudomonadota bacterium]
MTGIRNAQKRTWDTAFECAVSETTVATPAEARRATRMDQLRHAVLAHDLSVVKTTLAAFISEPAEPAEEPTEPVLALAIYEAQALLTYSYQSQRHPSGQAIRLALVAAVERAHPGLATDTWFNAALQESARLSGDQRLLSACLPRAYVANDLSPLPMELLHLIAQHTRDFPLVTSAAGESISSAAALLSIDSRSYQGAFLDSLTVIRPTFSRLPGSAEHDEAIFRCYELMSFMPKLSKLDLSALSTWSAEQLNAFVRALPREVKDRISSIKLSGVQLSVQFPIAEFPALIEVDCLNAEVLEGSSIVPHQAILDQLTDAQAAQLKSLSLSGTMDLSLARLIRLQDLTLHRVCAECLGETLSSLSSPESIRTLSLHDASLPEVELEDQASGGVKYTHQGLDLAGTKISLARFSALLYLDLSRVWVESERLAAAILSAWLKTLPHPKQLKLLDLRLAMQGSYDAPSLMGLGVLARFSEARIVHSSEEELHSHEGGLPYSSGESADESADEFEVEHE